MRTIKVHYIEKIELTEEYEISDEDFERLSKDECAVYDITNINEEAERYGDNWVEYETFDENGKMIWAF